MNERILAASDGTPGSLGALRLAHRIQERTEGEVRLVTAVSLPESGDAGLLSDAAAGELRANATGARERAIREQLESVRSPGAPPPSWPLEVRAGSPAAVVAEEAERTGATLVIVGLGRRRPADRFLGTGAAEAIAQLSPAPVLAVEPARALLPARILVAADFSRFSRRVAGRVPSLAAEGAEIHLLHVVGLPQESRAEWVDLYRKRAASLLDSLADDLRAAGVGRVVTGILSGDTATALLGYAKDRGIELVATGTHGHSFVSRALLGTVSGKLLRASECAVLVVPPLRSPD